MYKFQGWRAALAGTAVIAGLALPAVAAGPASAATAGGGGHGLRPELITETMSPKTPNGVVNMYGPIRGRDGTDKTVSNTLDVFVFTRGTVTIRHTNVSNVAPKINFRACTATVFATGQLADPRGNRGLPARVRLRHIHLPRVRCAPAPQERELQHEPECPAGVLRRLDRGDRPRHQRVMQPA